MVLPKTMRLKGYKCFDYIHKFSKRFKSESMMLKVSNANTKFINPAIRSKTDSCRCAISISNKVSKKAVVRNRLRRLFHNHLRNRLFRKPEFSNYWALISLNTRSLDKTPQNLLKECDKLLIEAGFKND